MIDAFWTLAGLGAATALATCVAVAWAWVRRRAARAASPLASSMPSPAYHLPPSIEVAEWEMAIVLRRLRAYLQDPYDFAASRIADDAAFETLLDRAAALGNRIAELGGAAPTGPAEHERARGLILDSLLLGRRLATTGAAPRAGRKGPVKPAQHPSPSALQGHSDASR